MAQSSAESEYVVVVSATQELIGLIKLLEDFNLPQKLPFIIYEDNISCMNMI